MPRGKYIKAPDKGAEARKLIAALLGVEELQWGSTKAAADLLKMKSATLSPYLTGKRRLTPAMRTKLEKA